MREEQDQRYTARTGRPRDVDARGLIPNGGRADAAYGAVINLPAPGPMPPFQGNGIGQHSQFIVLYYGSVKDAEGPGSLQRFQVIDQLGKILP